MFGSIKNCNNVKDFRELAKKKLPSPIFHYIDGAADDEITYKRNTDAFDTCDLVPNVLSGVDEIEAVGGWQVVRGGGGWRWWVVVGGQSPGQAVVGRGR